MKAELDEILSYLDEEYNIGMLYYPGSGSDSTPKDTLGKDGVVHLSLEENAERTTPYFVFLGRGLKVKGDYRQAPFANDSFDATLIYGIPPESAIDAIPEFRRVTKHNGLLIVGSHEICPTGDDFDIVAEALDEQLDRIQMPSRFSGFSVYKNKRYVC